MEVVGGNEPTLHRPGEPIAGTRPAMILGQEIREETEAGRAYLQCSGVGGKLLT